MGAADRRRVSNRDERLPVGQNNAGQKLVYWVFLATVPVLLVTGVVLWRPWVASECRSGRCAGRH